MYRFMLLAVPLFLAGCDEMFGADSVCMKGTLPPLMGGPSCNEQVENALDDLSFMEEDPVAFQPALPEGDHWGRVVGITGNRVEIDFEGTRGTLRWPRRLPFSIEEGEEMILQANGDSSTLFFAQGALAFQALGAAAPPPSKAQKIGSIEVRWEKGCSSRYGRAMDLVVGDARIPPGSSSKFRSWEVHNLGAVYDAEGQGCGDFRLAPFYGAWIAESTQERFSCSEPSAPADRCSEEVLQAYEEGMKFDFFLRSPPEVSIEVLAVYPDGFDYSPPGTEEVERFKWPGALPLEIEEGDLFEVSKEDEWTLIHLPRGELAYARTWGFGFNPPATPPKGPGGLFGHAGCALDETVEVASMTFYGTDDLILPGQEVQYGDWTYRLLYARQIEGSSCKKGGEFLFVHEGFGEGALVAYRRFSFGPR